MVSHANLLSNSANLDHGWDHTPESVLVSWLPHFHDMGLIYGIIQPLYKGFWCVLMIPAAFTQQPLRWLQAISRYRATHSAAPNFAYELCVRKIAPEQRTALDLRSWRMALNGAEPIRLETLEQFAEMFAPCGFDRRALCPGYGLAEATLKVSATRWADEPATYTVQVAELEQHRVVAPTVLDQQTTTLVSSGRPALDTQVAIVHPETLTRCAPDEVGEIWVAGSGVTHGYWNRRDETERTFRAFLRDTCEGPFLRTGDLGFVRDGELFITGRLKDLIVINGRNYYPQDIEQTVERSHPAVRTSCCAAFSVTIDGEERLVVMAEIERRYRPGARGEPAEVARLSPESEEIVKAMRRAVAEQHEVRLYDVQLLKVGSIPKTSSGKIQRHACRTSFLNGSLSDSRKKT